MMENNEKAASAYARYIAMGPSRSLRKLADETGIRLSLLGQWSSEQKWKERIDAQGVPEHKETPDRLTDLEREQATLRTQKEEQRTRLTALQQTFAEKLSAARMATMQRATLVTAVNTAQQAVRSAQEGLARHINTATESVYADKLFEIEPTLQAAQAELAAFDAQQIALSTDQLQADREAIRELEATLEQTTMHLRTLSLSIEQAIEQELRSSLEHVLTAYLDLYAVLEKDGPILARLRVHDPVTWHPFMRTLALDQQQLWDCIHPYAGHTDKDFRPFLRERQALIETYLGTLATKGSLT